LISSLKAQPEIGLFDEQGRLFIVGPTGSPDWGRLILRGGRRNSGWYTRCILAERFRTIKLPVIHVSRFPEQSVWPDSGFAG
jgi:hypothetical protein